MLRLANPFGGFDLKRFDPGVGLLKFVSGDEHADARAFLEYQRAVDVERGKLVEVVHVDSGKDLRLPCSVRGKSEIVSAGTFPKFIATDTYGNLTAEIPEGCVVRVEFLGKIGAKRQVKYFSTL